MRLGSRVSPSIFGLVFMGIVMFLNWRCVDDLFLNVVYALWRLMLFAINLIIMCGMFVWCSLCVCVYIDCV